METETNQWRQDNLCANTSVVFFFCVDFLLSQRQKWNRNYHFLGCWPYSVIFFQIEEKENG